MSLNWTYGQLKTRAGKVNICEALAAFHEYFCQMATGRFDYRNEPWMDSFKLAAIAKFIILCGKTGPLKRAPRIKDYDFARLLNPFSKLWKEAEEQFEYPSDPEVKGLFLIRLAYQQRPFHMHRLWVPRKLGLVRQLYGETAGGEEVNRLFQQRFGISISDLIRTGEKLHAVFVTKPKLTAAELSSILNDDATSKNCMVSFLGATQREFRSIYQQTKPDALRDIPYEFNPLMVKPIYIDKDLFFCPFPEMIIHAITDGLFFALLKQFGEDFSRKFGPMFEECIGKELRLRCPTENIVLGEQDERRLGWKGKTNDWTVIRGNSAILFECKPTALFPQSKVLADFSAVRQDLSKYVINAEKRKGLYQLYDKIEAIRRKELPEAVQKYYSNVTEFYPVLLTYDRLPSANGNEVFRNYLEQHLQVNGVTNFDFQLWPCDEFGRFLESVKPLEFFNHVKQKFSLPYKELDLDMYTANTVSSVLFLGYKPRYHLPQSTRSYDRMREIAD